MIPFIALMLAVAGITLGATALTLSKFKDTTSDNDALSALNFSIEAIGDVSEQMPTVGIIAIMVIIISLIVGIFAYIKFFS